MKVIQLIQKPQLRGAEMFASQLSNHLLALGDEVKLICLQEGSEQLPFQDDMVRLKRPPSRRLIDIAGWRKLAREINKFNPDLVQANAGDTLKYAVLSKLMFGWKATLVFRNANKVSDFIKSTPHRWFNKFLIRYVDHVVSVSEASREDFIRIYNYDRSKISVIPIGIEMEKPAASSDDLESIFSPGNVILHVASFVREKNHEGLLRMIEQVGTHSSGPIRLVLAGDGKLRSVIERQIKERNLQSAVNVLGYRSDILSLMSRARVLVLPSLIEGLPGVILEAMFCKLPVVAYDVGGISEVVRNGETGWLVKKNDEEGFVNAVKEVLTGNNVDQRINRAYELMVKKFDNRIIAMRFRKLYEQRLVAPKHVRI